MRFKVWLENMQGMPSKIVAPREDLYEVVDANFIYGIIVGKQMANVQNLHGGIRQNDPKEKQRVDLLAQKMTSPGGYIERIIVDDQNNVVEGQHRFEAARMLQWPQIPIVRVADLGRIFNFDVMRRAAEQAKTTQLHGEQVDQIVKHAIDTIWEEGKQKALAEYEMPPSIQPMFVAAINAAPQVSKRDFIRLWRT
jgi:hypothetical protein